MKRSLAGMSVIELLIVMAVMAILASMLIPNLFAARRTAQDSGTRSFGSQIYTTINAIMAEDINATVDDFPSDCLENRVFATPRSGSFEVSDPGDIVTRCELRGGEGQNTLVTVEVESINGNVYVFGAED